MTGYFFIINFMIHLNQAIIYAHTQSTITTFNSCNMGMGSLTAIFFFYIGTGTNVKEKIGVWLGHGWFA